MAADDCTCGEIDAAVYGGRPQCDDECPARGRARGGKLNRAVERDALCERAERAEAKVTRLQTVVAEAIEDMETQAHANEMAGDVGNLTAAIGLRMAAGELRDAAKQAAKEQP